MLKRIVERAAVASGMLRVLRSRRPGVLVLAYHNVVPDGQPPAGDRSLHLARNQFAAQLDELSATCQVVPLDEVLTDQPQRTRAGKPRVAITFDDCYHGAIELGVAELAKRGLPATCFVTPGLLDGATFWWDGLADPVGGLPPTIRDHVLTECQGRTGIARTWAAANGIPWHDLTGPLVSCSTDQLKAAIDSGTLSVGCHTWTHPNVTMLDPDDLRQELTATYQWLMSHVPTAARPWITWPYGLAGEAAQAVARDTGYSAAFRVDGGWMQEPGSGFALPRFNVPAGLSLDGFRIRLAGLLAG